MLTTKQGLMYNAGQRVLLLERAVRHCDAMTCSLVIPCGATDDYRDSLPETGIKNYFVSGNVRKKSSQNRMGCFIANNFTQRGCKEVLFSCGLRVRP